MQYNAVSIDKLSFGDITFVIDYDMDGNDDYTGTLAPTLGEIKHEEFAVSSGSAGTLWSFDIIGEGFKLVQPLRDRNYVEFRIEYEMSVQFVLSGGGGDGSGVHVTRLLHTTIARNGGGDGSGENNETGIYVPYAKFPAIGAPLTHGTPGTEYSGEVVTIPKNYFDLTEVVYHPADEPTVEQIDEKRSYWPIAAVLIILIIIFIVLMRLRRIKT